jgi:hypothetical protein
MAGSICIPCAWQNGVSNYRQSKLLKDAKELAINTGKYYSIIFDEEDKDFEIMELEEVKANGLTDFIQDTFSPYQTIAT